MGSEIPGATAPRTKVVRVGTLPSLPVDRAPDPKLAGDQLSLSTSTIAQVRDRTSASSSEEGKAFFATGKDDVIPGSQLDKFLDDFLATLAKRSPEEQKALLTNPNFKIVVAGHASNLGNATGYDNQGLAARRAEKTAAYVEKYLNDGLRRQGSELTIDSSHISSGGKGTPGAAKASDNNDQMDRSASVKIVMPPAAPVAAQAGPPVAASKSGADTTPTEDEGEKRKKAAEEAEKEAQREARERAAQARRKDRFYTPTESSPNHVVFGGVGPGYRPPGVG